MEGGTGGTGGVGGVRGLCGYSVRVILASPVLRHHRRDSSATPDHPYAPLVDCLVLTDWPPLLPDERSSRIAPSRRCRRVGRGGRVTAYASIPPDAFVAVVAVGVGWPWLGEANARAGLTRGRVRLHIEAIAPGAVAIRQCFALHRTVRVGSSAGVDGGGDGGGLHVVEHGGHERLPRAVRGRGAFKRRAQCLLEGIGVAKHGPVHHDPRRVLVVRRR